MVGKGIFNVTPRIFYLLFINMVERGDCSMQLLGYSIQEAIWQGKKMVQAMAIGRICYGRARGSHLPGRGCCNVAPKYLFGYFKLCKKHTKPLAPFWLSNKFDNCFGGNTLFGSSQFRLQMNVEQWNYIHRSVEQKIIY